MHLPTRNRALLRGMVAGAVVLAAASACSRPDRADAGRDTTQASQPSAAAAPADSQSIAASANPAPGSSDTTVAASNPAPKATSRVSKPTPAPRTTATADTRPAGYQAMGRDSTAGAKDGSSSTIAVGDSAEIGKPGERITSTETSHQANADTLASASDSTRIRPPAESSAVATTTDSNASASNDSSVAGSTEMARDTSKVLAKADSTTAQPTADTAARTSADTGAIGVKMDTATADQQTQVAVEAPADTAVAAPDSAEAGKTGDRLEATAASPEANADTLSDTAERIRPPEDSTETLGQVNRDSTEVGADTAAAGAAGVEPTGNMATGDEAVALIGREGQRCAVLSSDKRRDAQWDLAGSPATMNPCGTGTMTLPRVQTGE